MDEDLKKVMAGMKNVKAVRSLFETCPEMKHDDFLLRKLLSSSGKVRMAIQCGECFKSRCVYSDAKLTSASLSFHHYSSSFSHLPLVWSISLQFVHRKKH